MLSDSPYCNALPMSHAREEIRPCADKQFDPKIVEVFLSIPENHWIVLRENLGSPFRLTRVSLCHGSCTSMTLNHSAIRAVSVGLSARRTAVFQCIIWAFGPG